MVLWKVSASARSSSLGFSPSDSPEHGTSTLEVRTEKQSRDRCSLIRSWDERFHRRPVRERETT